MSRNINYFISGVPPGSLFAMSRSDLLSLVNINLDKNNFYSAQDTLIEVCYIGLLAYFEGFIKNHISATINLCPKLLDGLAENSSFVINIDDLKSIGYNLNGTLGSVVTEKIDFGSPKKINYIYKSLFNFTPFTKAQVDKLNIILNDRNLLVHHTGIVNSKYLKNRKNQKINYQLYLDSLVINKNYYLQVDVFLKNLVLKILENSSKSILLFIKENNIKISKDKKFSLDSFCDDYGLFRPTAVFPQRTAVHENA